MNDFEMLQVRLNHDGVRELTVKADGLFPVIAQLVIANEAGYENGGDLLREIAGYQKSLDELFKEQVQNAHKLHRFLVALRDGIGDKFEKAKALVAAKMTEFRRVKEAEARKLQEAAIAEQKRKADEEAKALWADGQRKKAQEVKAQAAAATWSIVLPVIPKIEGISPRKTWKHRVVDFESFVRTVADGKAGINLLKINPDWIDISVVRAVAEDKLPLVALVPNEKTLAEFARSTKGNIKINGVQFYEEEQTIGRF